MKSAYARRNFIVFDQALSGGTVSPTSPAAVSPCLVSAQSLLVVSR